MNKQELDKLFEQAKAELRADMPIDDVKELIQKPATSSFWKAKNQWIMGTSIFSVVTISTLLLFNYNFKTNLKNNYKVPKHQLETLKPEHKKEIPSNTQLKPEFAISHNNPVESLTTPFIKSEAGVQEEKTTPAIPDIAPPTDSLIPKETFREYSVSIQKNSNMSEIKALEKELAIYGILMHIDELAYDGKKEISSFKGYFDTDELFCGTAIKKHKFNFGSNFQEVQFTFRVAKSAQKLKYFSIQSDNMKNNIECYDDEVISDAAEARKIQEEVAREMVLSKEEMKRAMTEMKRAMEEMARNKAEIKRSIEKEFKTQMDLEKLINEEVKTSLEQSLKVMEKELAKIDTLKGLEAEELREHLQDLRSDIKIELKDALNEFDKEEMKRELKEAMREMKEGLREAELEMKEEMRKMEKKRKIILKEQMEEEDCCEPTPEELEDQAKALKQKAKELKKKAKLKKKEARQKKKNKEKK